MLKGLLRTAVSGLTLGILPDRFAEQSLGSGRSRRPSGEVSTDELAFAQERGLTTQQIQARSPQVDAISQFYESVYGSGLSERGRAQADYFFNTGNLSPNSDEFDSDLNFERAFNFLVQQREDALQRSSQKTISSGGFSPGMNDRVAGRSLTYSGENVLGI